MINSVTLTFGYAGTDFTRQYKFDNVPDEALSGLKARILDFNSSIATDTDLKTFFISDDFDAQNAIGTLTGIVAAQYTTQNVTDIPLT